MNLVSERPSNTLPYFTRTGPGTPFGLLVRNPTDVLYYLLHERTNIQAKADRIAPLLARASQMECFTEFDRICCAARVVGRAIATVAAAAFDKNGVHATDGQQVARNCTGIKKPTVAAIIQTRHSRSIECAASTAVSISSAIHTAVDKFGIAAGSVDALHGATILEGGRLTGPNSDPC